MNVLKPFCYYCDKEFENVNILLQHQKNRHFACKSCSRKFSTASSLCTHMKQVHTSSIQKVPNAIAGRDKVDINVYGMEGVPSEVIEDRLSKKIRKKMMKLEKELKAQYAIDLEDSKFDLKDWEVADPRPCKRHKANHLPGHLPPLGGQGGFLPPPGMFPPGMPPPAGFRMPPPPQGGA